MGTFDGSKVNTEVCRALGLNPSKVKRIDILVEGGKPPRVLVEYLPDALAVLEASMLIARARGKPA